VKIKIEFNEEDVKIAIADYLKSQLRDGFMVGRDGRLDNSSVTLDVGYEYVGPQEEKIIKFKKAIVEVEALE
jgi:hypothetical protein